MKLFYRYIAVTTAAGIVLSVVVLVLLDALFAFVAELPDVGRERYGAMQALVYVSLTVPRRAYELFPTAALLGTVLGMGALAVRSELVAFRAAGISRRRIGLAAIGAAVFLLIPMMLMGEFVLPDSERSAQALRLSAQGRDLSVGGPAGFWARQGNRVIHAQRLLENGALAEVTVYQFGPEQALLAVTRAALAQPVDTGWRLSRVARTEIYPGGSRTEHPGNMVWPELVDPDLLRVAAMQPENLSIRDLLRFVAHLEANELDAYRYRQVMWSKIFYPLTTIALVAIGLPFVFGSARTGGFGQRVFIGVVIGLVFFLVTRALARLGDVYQLDPLLITVVPPLLLLFGSGAYLRRTFA